VHDKALDLAPGMTLKTYLERGKVSDSGDGEVHAT
jgi:hypothetical protein